MLFAESGSFLSDQTPPLFSIQPSDKFEFGRLWNHVKALEEQNLLFEMIQKRREEIQTIKSHWKEKISTFENPLFLNELKELLSKGSLVPTQQGCGAAYFLFDENEIPRYVIKPFDEEILCLNNRKHFASPYNNRAFRVRDAIPLYRSAQAEVLASRFAKILELEHLIPPTHLAILSTPSFYDFGERLEPKEKENLYSVGLPDQEKLCSVQRYLPEVKNLYCLVEEWLENDLTDAQILDQVAQTNFEELVLLIWLLYDTDAHAGNLYVQKSKEGRYRLLKFDNGLTFPEQNCHLLNALYFFPHAAFPLSKKTMQRIQNLPFKKLIDEMSFFEMEGSIDAFCQRFEILQKLASNANYTIRDIDVRLKILGIPDGEKLAISSLSTPTLQRLLEGSIYSEE